MINHPIYIAFGAVTILLPFYNLVFIWCAFKYKSNTQKYFTISNVLLFICTIITLCWGAIFPFTDYKDYVNYPALIWSLSFIFLLLAIILKLQNKKRL